MKSAFIVFEGIDGCGKSTQAEILAEYFSQMGKECVLTREPSDGKVGQLLRQALRGEVKFCEQTMAALFAADRLDHLTNQENGVLKALSEGKIVICDRYYLSTYAYQSVEVDLEWAMALNSQAAQIARPTVNIYLDISVDKALERISRNRGQIDIYESKERLSQTKKSYEKVIAKLKAEENILIIQGEQSLEEVAQNIRQSLEKLGLFEE